MKKDELHEVIKKESVPVNMSAYADTGTYTEDIANANGRLVVPKGVKPTKDVVDRMNRWASMQ